MHRAPTAVAENALEDAGLFSAIKECLAAYPDPLFRRLIVVLLLFLGLKTSTVGSVVKLSDRQIRSIKAAVTKGDGQRVTRTLANKSTEGKARILQDGHVGTVLQVIMKIIHAGQKPSRKSIAEGLAEHSIKVDERTVGRFLAKHRIYDAIPHMLPDATCLGRTRFAGVWLLLPNMLAVVKGFPPRVREVLATIYFMAVCGVARFYHLQDYGELPVGLFTGRCVLMAASTMTNRLRRIKWKDLKEVMARTRPDLAGPEAMIAVDEHVVARFTQQVKISKTKHPTRNRVFKADKLFYAMDIVAMRFVDLLVRPGRKRLSQVAPSIVRRLRQTYKGTVGVLRIFLDAGAYSVACIFELSRIKGVIFVMRAIAYKSNLEQWNKIDPALCAEYIRPCDRRKKNPKIYRIADTTTFLERLDKHVRTILIIDPDIPISMKGKRYYALLTNDTLTPAVQLADSARLRWRIENAYRISKHDLFLDALPQSYEVGKGIQEPIKRDIPITLVAWMKAVVFNDLRDFASRLPERFQKMHAGTLIRKFIMQPGTLFVTQNQVTVELDHFRDIEHLADYIVWLNGLKLEIPWMANRVLHVRIKGEGSTYERLPYRKRKGLLTPNAA